MRVTPAPYYFHIVCTFPYHLRKKKRKAPKPFPRAMLMINALRYLTTFALRINMGNTLSISASAMAQHPAKIPAKAPNTARRGVPRGIPI